jgi:hypothetical protein
MCSIFEEIIKIVQNFRKITNWNMQPTALNKLFTGIVYKYMILLKRKINLLWSNITGLANLETNTNIGIFTSLTSVLCIPFLL